MRVGDREYFTLLGSDPDRDGMFLELIYDFGNHRRGAAAEWFYSDLTGKFAFTAYETDLPEALLAWFEEEAYRRLPPNRASERDS